MLASLLVGGAATGVSVAVDTNEGVVSNSQPAAVQVLCGQAIGITLDSGGDEYEGVVTIEIEME